MIEIEAETQGFSFVGRSLCLDFTNTVSGFGTSQPGEKLPDYAHLVQWGREAGVLSGDQARRLFDAASSHGAETAQVHRSALALRDAIHWIFSSIADGGRPERNHLETLNAELSHAMCHSRVIPVEKGFEWDWTGGEDALDSILWPVARSAADLLTSEEHDRVRECAGDDCGWLFLDMSRNHSRHWCDMRDCGNRAKARRHYERKKSDK